MSFSICVLLRCQINQLHFMYKVLWTKFSVRKRYQIDTRDGRGRNTWFTRVTCTRAFKTVINIRFTCHVYICLQTQQWRVWYLYERIVIFFASLYLIDKTWFFSLVYVSARYETSIYKFQESDLYSYRRVCKATKRISRIDSSVQVSQGEFRFNIDSKMYQFVPNMKYENFIYFAWNLV